MKTLTENIFNRNTFALSRLTAVSPRKFYSTHPGGSISAKSMKTLIENIPTRHTHARVQRTRVFVGLGFIPAQYEIKRITYLLRRLTRAKSWFGRHRGEMGSEQKAKGEEKANRYRAQLEIS